MEAGNEEKVPWSTRVVATPRAVPHPQLAPPRPSREECGRQGTDLSELPKRFSVGRCAGGRFTYSSRCGRSAPACTRTSHGVPSPASLDPRVRAKNFELLFRLGEERAGVPPPWPPLLDVDRGHARLLPEARRQVAKSVMTYVAMIWDKCAALRGARFVGRRSARSCVLTLARSSAYACKNLGQPAGRQEQG